MQDAQMPTLERLVRAHLGDEAGKATLDTLDIAPALTGVEGDKVPRAVFATALGVTLYHALLARVPSARDYVAERMTKGERIMLDHGALRTIRFAEGPTGALPAGQEAFARILVPLGYQPVKDYPLPRLKMTGYAYCHADFPQDVVQYFVSELHVEQFDEAFAKAAQATFSTSHEPLGELAHEVLLAYAARKEVTFEQALAVLPTIAGAFERQHAPVHETDYETLLAQSAEAAWIATEGNAFNHATDRVADVTALADDLRERGKPVKDKVEHSASGRVHQTALRADTVTRTMIAADGSEVTREVPGSFFEFITRDPLPGSDELDLGFDSGNATGIFGMTRAA